MADTKAELNFKEIAENEAVRMDAGFGAAGYGVEKPTPMPGIWPFAIGQAYLFRLATFSWSGIVVAGNADWILLDHAAWVPLTGRFNETTKNANFEEVEPVQGRAIISRGAVVDAVAIPKAPREVK